MTITSDPPGATVTVNEVEIGRTPVSAAFTYYSDYEVQVEREGYEPVRTKATAWAPVYEWIPLDLISSAMPFTLRNEVKFHYPMTPTLESTQPRDEFERGLLERAATLRRRIE